MGKTGRTATKPPADAPGRPSSRTHLSIDDFARSAGTTTRNVRALQSAGLLKPPVLAGRTGYYGPEHLRRLEAVRRLRSQGFSLAAIRSLFDAHESGRSLEDVLGWRVATAHPGRARRPEGEAEDHAYAWLEDWPGRRHGPALALVPSSLLGGPRAS